MVGNAGGGGWGEGVVLNNLSLQLRADPNEDRTHWNVKTLSVNAFRPGLEGIYLIGPQLPRMCTVTLVHIQTCVSESLPCEWVL